MKSIIEGRLYNTETATRVACYSNGRTGHDFRRIDEELYIKKTGEWFLERYGGPLTEYAEVEGNNRSGRTVIIPFTEDEAKDWLAKYDYVDQYIEYFGEPEE